MLTLLSDAEWARWSDSEIGRRAAVHQTFVSKVRRDLTQDGLESDSRTFTTKHGTVATPRSAPDPYPPRAEDGVRALTAKDGGKAAGRETGTLGPYIDRLPARFAHLATGADVEIASAAEPIGGGVSILVDSLARLLILSFERGDMRTTKIQVTERAVVQRINRRLAAEEQVLRASRTDDPSIGRWFIVDTRRNAIDTTHVDIEALARELGALADWETLAK